ncbi:MAG: fatty-acid synthase [Candidatus Tectomicrobia bacterium]|uniref:Fatty-acid synthase n=1 Tax=Tectimicrobiota bacterium TaxID=2528274 RepID=A0A938B600_UNCTE|nr:fatty-acid synthase [Candidatus Tectomicrobia bacterium]
MPGRDLYHDTVVHALHTDGWTITHDPLSLSYGGRDLYVDLGAERLTLAAEKGHHKIALEIKSFLGMSLIRDLEEAVGQYQVYRSVLAEIEADRSLYLAVAQRVYDSLFTERFGQLILTSLQLRLMVFDEQRERIVAWIP